MTRKYVITIKDKDPIEFESEPDLKTILENAEKSLPPEIKVETIKIVDKATGYYVI